MAEFALPDPEALHAVLMVLKDADVRKARVGELEIEFSVPTPPITITQVPPAQAGKVTQKVDGVDVAITPQPDVPPAYAALLGRLPGGVPRFRGE